MEIILYTNNSNYEVADKDLTLVGTYEFLDFKDDNSVESPHVRMDFDALPEFNYAYLSVYDRYYFVSTITKEENGLFTIYLLDDVRMNFKSWYRQCEGIIGRQEHLYNLYQTDEMFGTYADRFTVCKYIGDSEFNPDAGSDVYTGNVVLIVN